MPAIVVHGHFYQPPRENPWTGLVDPEGSAAPWHDWNARIEHECYSALASARLTTPEGDTRATRNLYEKISFDFGPTLLEWLATNARDTYEAIIGADATSAATLGHGNAIATPYHHVILPLASRRDKVTEVRWGMRDFRKRFGRNPEGMWLPETAVDQETLEVLAAEGIRFTILAPHQVSDTHGGLPTRIGTGGGREMIVFAYDGGLSHDVAFGPLIQDANVWAERMLAHGSAVELGLVTMATDGETYGHHHTFGEMALAALTERLEATPSVQIDNFTSLLARNDPPADRVTTLVERTSWSCVHGLERWRADCGCRAKEGTSQAWRAPLREALEWLRDQLVGRYVARGNDVFDDPWAARDTYDPDLDSSRGARADALLEMQHNALRMFTSCGWFFDDLEGLETLICLRSAARAIDLSDADTEELLTGFRERLEQAPGIRPELATGAAIFDRLVWSLRPKPDDPV